MELPTTTFNATEDTQILPASSIQKTIYCRNSGTVLGRLDICIFEGHLAYFEAHTDAAYLHPFYRMSSTVLLRKLEDSLHHAQESGWALTWREQQRLQLLVSALLHSLDCIRQDQSSLPSFEVAAGSAGRLLALARWFFFVSSQRLAFPIYHICKKNENLQWENFKFWLDAAFKIREDWAKKTRVIELEAKKKAQEESLREIKSEAVFKRLDMRKIWNWIDIQLVDHFAPGRIETFKNFFLNGDLEVFLWSEDDVDDFKEALFSHCDQGNDIMFFINKRCAGIRALIKDFNSSFTILNRTSSQFREEEQTPQEALFLSEYDKKAEALEELPERPKREAFATHGLFLRAEAQWNILARRWKHKEQVQSDKAEELKEPQWTK